MSHVVRWGWLIAIAGCCFGPSAVELEGPVRAEVGYERDNWGASHGVVRVRAPITATLGPGCTTDASPEIAGDGTADRFAYRCNPGEGWTLVYVGPSALIVHCASPLGVDEAPAFARAPASFLDAAEELAVCAAGAHGGWPGEPFPTVFQQAEALGPAALQTALLRTRPHTWAQGWESALARLPEPHATELRATIRAELENESPSAPAVCRAVLALGSEDPVVRRRAPEILESAGHPPRCPEQESTLHAAIRGASDARSPQ